MSRTLTLENYSHALTLWKELMLRYPKCFFPAGQEKPLKIGIFHDLATECSNFYSMPSKKLLRVFMEIYTGSIFYRAAFISPNAMRIDLNGNETKLISPKERLQAKLETRKLRWALDTTGFEKEKADAKAKRKELKIVLGSKNESENSKRIKQVAAVTNPGTPSRSEQKGVTTPTVTIKKSIPIIVKKKRTIPPNKH
jgi:ProP effector